MPADDEASKPPSRDAKVIAERVQRQRRFDRFWQQSLERKPRLAAAVELREEFELLAAIASGGYHRPKQLREAARILVRRFGALGSRHLIASMLEDADTPYRLILRKRANAERPDKGKTRQAIDQDWEDYRFLEAVEKQRQEGTSRDEAIEAVQRKFDLPLTIEGGKKVLARARKRARERGYADPYAPFKAAIIGGPYEPDIKVEDLPRRGRPKNATKPD